MDSFNKLILFFCFSIFSFPVFSNAVLSEYVNSNYSKVSIRAPTGYSVLKGTPTNLLRSAANSAGFVMSGDVAASVNGSKLPLKLASKITPVSLGKAIAKAAFRPVPLLLAVAVGGALIKRYGDNIYNGSEWMKPQTSIYSNYTFSHSGVTAGSLDSVISQMKTVYFSHYDNVTYKIGTMGSGLPVRFTYTLRGYGFTKYQDTIISYVKKNTTSVQYVPSDEPTLTTQVAEELMNNPTLASSLFDQLSSNNITVPSVDSVSGPASIVGDVSTVTLPESIVIDANSNKITTQDKIVTTVNYNLNYNPDNSITVNPTKVISKVTDTVSTKIDSLTGLPVAPPVFSQSKPKVTTQTTTAPTGETVPIDPPKNICETNPDSLACAKIGTLSTAPAVSTKIIPFSYSPVSLSSNSVCPTPKSFIIAGRSYSISSNYLCDFANGINPVVLAICGISAVLIVSGGIRNG